MGLRLHPSPNLSYNSFGTDKNVYTETNKTTVKLFSKKGTIILPVLTINKIGGHFQQTCTPQMGRNLSGLNLDNANINGNVDLLLGCDVYWSCVTGEIRNQFPGPVAMNNIFGWLISGKNKFQLIPRSFQVMMLLNTEDITFKSGNNIDKFLELHSNFGPTKLSMSSTSHIPQESLNLNTTNLNSSKSNKDNQPQLIKVKPSSKKPNTSLFGTMYPFTNMNQVMILLFTLLLILTSVSTETHKPIPLQTESSNFDVSSYPSQQILTLPFLPLGRKIHDTPELSEETFDTIVPRRIKSMESIYSNSWNIFYMKNFKHNYESGNTHPKIDDVVHVKVENQPGTQWSLGRITKIIVGKDKAIRAAKVRMPLGERFVEITLPIQ